MDWKVEERQQGRYMFRLKVKEKAKEKKISQGRLSRMADVDDNTLQKVFRDPHANITLYTLDKLAVALGVDIRDLIESVPEEP